MTQRDGIPVWLREELATPRQRHDDFRQEAPAEVLPGDLCVVTPFARADGPGRLFLVTDAANGWCEGMLAGTDTELATEVDAVIPSADSGLSYEVAVYSRFHGPIWVTQVLRRVGAIESTVLHEIEMLAWTDDAQVNVRVGFTLQPEGIDPRYPALQRMSAELDTLTDHCRLRRHDLTKSVLDPALGEVDVLRVLLRERGWEQHVSDALSSPGFRDRLLRAMPQLSRDERRVVMPLIERATLTQPFGEAPTASAMIDDHVDPEALAAVVAYRGTASPATVVLSHRRCWQRAAAHPTRLYVSSHETVLVFGPVSETPLPETA